MEFLVDVLLRVIGAALNFFELHTLTQFFKGNKTLPERYAERLARKKLSTTVDDKTSSNRAPKG